MKSNTSWEILAINTFPASTKRQCFYIMPPACIHLLLLVTNLESRSQGAEKAFGFPFAFHRAHLLRIPILSRCSSYLPFGNRRRMLVIRKTMERQVKISSLQILQKRQRLNTKKKTSHVTPQRNKLKLAACWKTQMQLSDSLVTGNESGYVNYLFAYQLCYVLLSRDICII